MTAALAGAETPETLIGVYPDDEPIFEYAIPGLRVEALDYPLTVEAGTGYEQMTVKSFRTLKDRREVEEWAEEEFGSGGWEIVSLSREGRYHHALREALAAVYAAADLFARHGKTDEARMFIATLRELLAVLKGAEPSGLWLPVREGAKI
jgi:hypothetical protein